MKLFITRAKRAKNRHWQQQLVFSFLAFAMMVSALAGPGGVVHAGDAQPATERDTKSNSLPDNTMPAGTDPHKMLSSAAQKQVPLKQAEYAKVVAQNAAIHRTNYAYMNKVLDVPAYQQINGYYCGVASTQMVLGYQGRYYSQSYLGGLEGTTTGGTYVYRITNALNQLGARPTNWWVYESYSNRSYDDFMNKTGFDLVYNVPTVTLLMTNPPDGTPYKLPGYVGNYGHYIVNHGRTGDTVYYTDPYQETRRGGGITLGRHSTAAYQMYWINRAAGGWIVW